MSGEPRTVRGTPLELADLKKGKVFTTAYVPKIQYAWDTGVAIGRYLEELKNGRLIARRCQRCQRTMVPPRMFCERCFRSTDEWVYVQDTGTVNTFSLCYVSWDVRRLKTPEIPAVIEIDGASPGMGIMHVLGKVNPKQVRVGMRVRAVWKPPPQRTGSITDILYFAPIKGKTTKVGTAKKPR
ncbi:MAG: Zn-ribbon domain-containing OB-fold protein [Acidobacteria bacterium]|nr:Zn-ribbon domain-containing OB-fold protein [Acidobacteriota bacterium]